jgi:predicted kinase
MIRPPTLIAVTGPPGAGKTTLARALAQALDWPAVCRDEIKERMAPTHTGPASTLNMATFEEFFRRIGELLDSGTSLVAEAAFQDHLWRPSLEPLRELARLRILRCVVDPELARLRIARRAAVEPARAVHADGEFLRRIARGERPIESWVPPALDVPCLIVDTAQGWRPSLADIVEFATAPEARPGPR